MPPLSASAHLCARLLLEYLFRFSIYNGSKETSKARTSTNSHYSLTVTSPSPCRTKTTISISSNNSNKWQEEREERRGRTAKQECDERRADGRTAGRLARRALRELNPHMEETTRVFWDYFQLHQQ